MKEWRNKKKEEYERDVENYYEYNELDNLVF